MNLLHIARREWTGFFYSPIAYVVIAVFTLLSSIFFLISTFYSTGPAEMRIPFYWANLLLVPGLTPAISMRLLSEELRSGSIEPLMTSPVSDWEVVVGKWLGAVGFYCVMLLPTLVYVGVLEVWGAPDYGPIVVGYLGLLLVGSLYLAIGTLASTLTRNQIIAFLLAIGLILMMTLVTNFHLEGGEAWKVTLAKVMDYVNVMNHFEDFSKGIVDLTHLVYFASVTGLFLLLATQALQSRKWR